MKLLLRSILFSVFAGLPSISMADDIGWINGQTGSDGSWTNPNNWVTAEGLNEVPGPGDEVFIFPGYSITGQGSILLNEGGPTTISITSATDQTINGALIGSSDSQTTVKNGTLNLNFAGATLHVGNGDFDIGGFSTVNFTGNLSIPAADLIVGTPYTVTTFGSGIIGGVTNTVNGNGTFNLTAGSTVNMDSGSANAIILGDQGTTGTMTQAAGSIVTTGGALILGNTGGGAGVGNYTLFGNSVLNIGNQTTPQSNTYQVIVGDSNNSGGSTLTLTETSVINATNSGTFFIVGNTGGVGTVLQQGTSTANIGGEAFWIGEGGTGTYNLQSGALNVTSAEFIVGDGSVTTATGTFNQSGGVLNVNVSPMVIGNGKGTFPDSTVGKFNLSGTGAANLNNGLLLGSGFSTAIMTQTGGTLTVTGTTEFGAASTYLLSGGTATFNGDVIVDADLVHGSAASIVQTGGTFNVGTTLDLSALGTSYNLNGGTLAVGGAGLVGGTGEGRLNFGGGTLQISTAGAFTDPLDGTLSGVTTIDGATTAGVTTVTMGGNYDGPGGFNFDGGAGTIFQFAGTNTYTGLTMITAGTLVATAAEIQDSSAIVIQSAGTLDLTLDVGGLAFNGPIAGSGTLALTFAAPGDAFVDANTSAFTGNIAVGAAGGNAGVLQVYNGNFNNVSDNGTGSGITIGGTPLVAFPAGTTIPASGTVTIANATYTGLTTINPNFSLYTNGLDGSVANSGNLGLISSAPIGSTFNINGDFTQTATGAFVVRTSGATNDTYVATTANLNGKVVFAGAISGGAPYLVLTAAGGLTTGPLNDPAGLIGVSSFLIDPVLTQVGNTLTATLTSVPIVGNTPNQNAVAGALNANPNNPIFARINTPDFSNPNFYDFTAAQAPQILQELSPQVYQYMRQIAFENATFLVERMNNVDANLRASYGGLDTSAINIVNPGFNTGLGRSMGSLLASNDSAFHQTAPNGVNYYPGGSSSSSAPAAATPAEANPGWDSSSQVISDSPNPYLATQTPSGPETPGFSEFIGGDVILADLNKDSNDGTDKASYTAGDASAGVSFRMNSHLAMGVLFDYNHTDAKTDDSNSKTKIDSYTPGIFATYFDHGFYVNGLFAFGYNTYDNTRNMSLFGSTANSSPTGQQYTADIDAGYDFHPDKAWIVGPTLGLTYSHLDVDSFTESGAQALGADLAVQSQSVDSLRSRLGAHAIYQTYTGDVLLQPNISLVWQHEFLDDGDSITSSFADFASTPFSITPDKIGTDSALIGIGMTATLSNSMALYLNYIADVGASDYWAQSVIGGFKARF